MERLLQDPTLNLVRFCTTTSRAPREGEQHSVHYQFVSPEDFHAMAKAGAFFEWTEVYGHFYGTNKETLKNLRSGTRPIICVLGPKGARKMKEADPTHTTIVLIEAARETLLGRLRQRHTDHDDIAKRVERMNRELALYPLSADITVENDDGKLHETVQTVKDLILKKVS